MKFWIKGWKIGRVVKLLGVNIRVPLFFSTKKWYKKLPGHEALFYCQPATTPVDKDIFIIDYKK